MNNITPIRVHIGFHFWGAGNFGDDLMLAGFLSEIQKKKLNIELSCCSLFDLESQRYRFPEVRWFPYDDESRQYCVKNCDIWLGLGGSPFQTILSDWFLQHLAQELVLCELYSKKMFFLAVGLNDYPALEHPVTHQLLETATFIWTRDLLTAQALCSISSKKNIGVGGDLAHLFLQDYHLKKNNLAKVGFVMNFEENHSIWHNIMGEIVKISGGFSQCAWIAQEVRVLPGSELALYNAFAEESRLQLALICSDYARSRTKDFLVPFQPISLLITSRYHSALVGAWLGCRVLLMERNLKLKGLSEQWPVKTIHVDDDISTIHHAVHAASFIDHENLLQEVNKASRACHELGSIL